MTILYFTSTGNCLYIAKQIGGKCSSIPQLIKHKEYKIEDDKIGLVIPDYGLRIPSIVKEFLSKSELKADYVFAIITYGNFSGAVTSDLIKVGAEAGITFDYVEILKMQSNYLPWYEMKKVKQDFDQANMEQKLDKIKQDILKGEKHVHKDHLVEKLITKQHEKKDQYKVGVGFTKEISITDACSGCGTCAKLCPKDNIRIVEGIPKFKDHCMSCLSCVHGCPKKAIHIESEKSEERYRNPKISLQEILKSNQ